MITAVFKGSRNIGCGDNVNIENPYQVSLNNTTYHTDETEYEVQIPPYTEAVLLVQVKTHGSESKGLILELLTPNHCMYSASLLVDKRCIIR